MAIITGQQVGPALIAALGLPKQTRSFVLRVEIGRIVTVECEYFPDDGGIVAALAEYELMRKAPTVEPIVDTVALFGFGDFDAWMRNRTNAAHEAMMAHACKGGQAYQ